MRPIGLQALEAAGAGSVDVSQVLGDDALLAEALQFASTKKFEFLERPVAGGSEPQYVVRVR
jgi:hypothetical protein